MPSLGKLVVRKWNQNRTTKFSTEAKRSGEIFGGVL
jgi:hypothetical protein